ncbi:MAG: hypothetical protein RLZZ241_425 [Bacteroidota bacterium]
MIYINSKKLIAVKSVSIYQGLMGIKLWHLIRLIRDHKLKFTNRIPQPLKWKYFKIFKIHNPKADYKIYVMKPVHYKIFLMLFWIPIGIWAQQQPNIVLIFPDNIGIGEVASYGGARGVPTPNIDSIGVNGIRLTNFNVEYTCVPSRIALLTGRYAARTGENYFDGITLWEETLAEKLKALGYATGLFGKWDVGGPNWEGIRAPTDQGFDEWYGIPGTSHVAQFSEMPGFDPKRNPLPYVWEGKAGRPSEKVKIFDLPAKRTIDREAAERAVAFMERNAKSGKPFFVYYPMTQLHFPSLPHPDKIGSTGAGDMGDSMADVDYNVGLVLKALKQLDLTEKTLVIWCADNGAELRRPWRGNPGPWNGYYNSAMEGGVRTPAVIQWPGTIPAGRVSNAVIHETDLLPTIVAAAGGNSETAADRILDGVNQMPFLTGAQSESKRESVLFLNRFGKIMAIKWQNWKLWYDFKTELPDPFPENRVRLFDLNTDPREETDVKDYYPWVIGIMDRIALAYEHSLEAYPRVPAAANKTEPYTGPDGLKTQAEPAFNRKDRIPLEDPKRIIPNPDFSGSWSTTARHTVSVINREAETVVPDLGSGWGDRLNIQQSTEMLEVSRVFFTAREIQPTQRWTFPLLGGSATSAITMGRSDHPPITSGHWDQNRLVLSTTYYYRDLENYWREAQQIQTLWLEAPSGTPWEAQLVVETKRPAVEGGMEVVNRTYYYPGYQ